MRLEDGLVLFQSRLSSDEQRSLWRECRSLADGPVPMYTPTVRGGRRMSVGMLCLGRHWNGMTYTYESRRSDFDNLEAPPLPLPFAELARSAAASAGFDMQPDTALLIVVAVVDGRAPKMPDTMRTNATVIGVSAGAATAPPEPTGCATATCTGTGAGRR